MSDRLAELRRQRALVQAHLEWLDREIAAESTSAVTAAPVARIVELPAGSVPITPAAKPILPLEPPVAVPDAIAEELHVRPESVRQEVRKGCFLYFAAAFALFWAGVAVLYYFLTYR